MSIAIKYFITISLSIFFLSCFGQTPPVAISATSVTSSSLIANWNISAGAISYKLDVSTSSSFSSFVTGYNNLTVNSTSQNVTGLSANKTYYYRVRAVGTSGTSANSNLITTKTLLVPPVSLAATLITTTSLTAHWGSVTGASSYRFDLSTDNTFSSFISGYNNLTVSTTNKSVTGLSPGTTYYYRVRAVSTAGNTSLNSSVITVTTIPTAPTATNASNCIATSLTANWNSVNGATSYRLDVSTYSSFSSFVTGFNNLTVNGTSKTVTGLAANTTYYYRVRAVGASGTSSNSNIITTINPPIAPIASSGTVITQSSFTANWASSTGATSYRLDVSTNNLFSDFVTGYSNLSLTTLTRNVTGLTSGVTYYYRVRAVNSSGSVSENSSVITVLTLPSAPVPTSPSNNTASSFTANWLSVPTATMYYLDVSTSSSFSTFVTGYNNLLVTETSKIVTGLWSNTTFYYRVRARNNSGTSANSSTNTAVTTPMAPTVVAATSVTLNSFQANWNTVNGALSYRLDVSLDANFATFLSGYYDLEVPSNFTTVTGITEKLPYYYRVRAVNQGGASVNSGIITVNYSKNYVRTILLTAPGFTTESQVENATIANAPINYSFFDGLGRPIQRVAKQQSPNQLDIVQPIAYDGYGRESVNYLPYTSGNNGWFKLDFIKRDNSNYFTTASPQFNFYNNTSKVAIDSKPYSETTFEPSPLNRPAKSYAPGADWSDKPVELKYLINSHNIGTSTTGDKVIAWKINSIGMPVREAESIGYIETGGYYSSGQLFVNVTIDEQGNSVREYKNKEGQVILKKVQAIAGSTNLNSTTDWALTYYLYDTFGNLRFVLPPELSKIVHQGDGAGYNPSSTDISNWAFMYKYDTRMRMKVKKVPGADSVYMVYDKRDRLVFTQDGNQRSSAPKYWTFTKYDNLNRPILTGIKDTTAALTQAQMQTVVDAHYNKVWTKLGESYVGNVAGNVHGYTNKSFPVTTSPATIDKDRYLSVTYYDSYSFRSLWTGAYDYLNESLSKTANGISYTQPTTEITKVMGLVTGAKVKVLDGGVSGGYTWLKSVIYYDDKYRVVQLLTDNYKGGTDRTTNVYDFVGKILKSKSTHAESDVAWKDISGVVLIGNKLTRTAATASGAVSVQQLGVNQDGWLEVIVSQANVNNWVGFNDSNPDVEVTNIDYCFYLNTNTLRVYENNVLKYTDPTPLTPGDILKIERVGSTIKYYRNGQLLPYSKTGALTSALMVDVSLRTSGANLVGVRTSFSTTSHITTRRFEYDHAGRLVNTWHQLDTYPEILLSKNEYNELGQLVDKKLHSTVTSAADTKQSVDYRYNIRGWLTSMNNSQLTNDGVSNDDSNDFFGMNLGYNNDLGTGNTANLQYNGNISTITYSTNLGLGTVKELGYNFTYDPLNRLQHANHLKNNSTSWVTGNYSENNLTYDLNGNIKTLQRTGDGGVQVDDLVYDYGTTTSNKLTYVQDIIANSTDKAKGFVDGNTGTAIDYTYDGNGNMLTDNNKNITTNITYNFLNQPEKVTRNNSSVTYFYDAGGRKLGHVASYGGGTKYTEYAGEWIYVNDQPQFLHHEEGRIMLANNEQIFSTDGDDETVVTPAGNVSITRTPINGETYLKVAPASGIVLTKVGVSQIGGSIPVIEGEQYVFRVKGYSSSTRMAALNVKGNGVDMIWPGASLPTASAGQMWVENSLTIPVGITEITLGVLYNSSSNSTSSDFFYINDAELVKLTSTTPEYQYNLKDHLGNTRLTFTTKEETLTETATLEDANASDEQSQFVRYAEARKVQSFLFDKTNGSAPANTTGYAQRLSGSTNEKYGLGKSISVMPGDVIYTEVYAKYVDQSNINSGTSAGQELLSLLASISQGGAGVVVDGASYNSSTANFPFPTAAAQNTAGSSEAGPKAYLNWLVFDRDFNFILSESGYDRLSNAPAETGQDVAHELLYSPQITIKQPGYVYIYISNEEMSPLEVYFDDFKVEHIKSPVVQMDDYYPFGLTYNSYKRENSVQNNYLFNGGSELQNDLNLGLYLTLFRMYDPAIGRFVQIDPLADFFSGINPYNFAENNPILYGDQSGLSPNIWQRIKALLGIGRLSGKKGARNQEYVKPVAKNRGEKQPYLFPPPVSPPQQKIKPALTQEPVQTVAQEESEEESDISTPPILPKANPIKPIKPIKPTVKPKTQPESKPKPDPLPFGYKPGGSALTINAYEFQVWESDLYHTPANDKVISDLIKVLKSSSGIQLEIKGNLDDDPANPASWRNGWSDKYERQQHLINARAQAIYKALRDAGVPESQLKTSPGVIQSTLGRSNEGAYKSATLILSGQ